MPSSLVKEGKNVIAVRVFDRYGTGGPLGSEKKMILRKAFSDNHSSLTIGWILNLVMILTGTLDGSYCCRHEY